MKDIIIIAREAAYEILEALDYAVGYMVTLGWVVDQIRFEDAYGALWDAMYPTMPNRTREG